MGKDKRFNLVIGIKKLNVEHFISSRHFSNILLSRGEEMELDNVMTDFGNGSGTNGVTGGRTGGNRISCSYILNSFQCKP